MSSAAGAVSRRSPRATRATCAVVFLSEHQYAICLRLSGSVPGLPVRSMLPLPIRVYLCLSVARPTSTFVVACFMTRLSENDIQQLLTSRRVPGTASPLGWFSAKFSKLGSAPIYSLDAMHNLHNLHRDNSPKTNKPNGLRQKTQVTRTRLHMHKTPLIILQPSAFILPPSPAHHTESRRRSSPTQGLLTKTMQPRRYPAVSLR